MQLIFKMIETDPKLRLSYLQVINDPNFRLMEENILAADFDKWISYELPVKLIPRHTALDDLE